VGSQGAVADAPGSAPGTVGETRSTARVTVGVGNIPRDAAGGPPAGSQGVVPGVGSDTHAERVGTAGGPAATKPTGTAGCTEKKTPIIIGSVGQTSGLVGSIIGNGARAVSAWAASMNDKGGLNCHPVKYIVADDGGDPSRHQAEVQRLVEQEHVVAFVHTVALLTGRSSVSYLTQKRIPVIGNEGGSSWFYTSPMYFPQAASGAGLIETGFAAVADVALAQGKTKLGSLACIEVSTCSEIQKYAPTWAQQFGMTLAYNGTASLVQPDYTAVCQSAKSAGAQVLIIGLDGNSISRVARSCAGVGFTPIYATISSIASPSMVADARLDGAVVDSTVLPWLFTTNPGVAEFHSAMKRYAPSVAADIQSEPGWVSAKLFELAARGVSDPPTSQSILEGLWSIKNDDLGGLTGPLTFTRDENAPKTICYWTLQVKGGAFTTPRGADAKCPKWTAE
jgi:ABC-type branched-subunit amino acid transport system substrate-binding protein